MKAIAKRILGYSEPFNLVEQEEDGHKIKKGVLMVTLFALLVIGIVTGVRLNALPPTFNGKVDVAALQQDPDHYDLQEADGAAYMIVSENLARTTAKNVCFSVVFNFRGYDTMGESFILIAALAGSLCILRKPKKKKEGEEETSHE